MQDQSIKQAVDALINRGETRSIIDKSSAAWRELPRAAIDDRAIGYEPNFNGRAVFARPLQR